MSIMQLSVSSSKPKAFSLRWRQWQWTLLLLVLLSVGAIFLSTTLSIGNITLTPAQIWHTIFDSQASSRLEQVAVHTRLPRAIMAFLVGAGLAVAGVLLQALYRNPLADPSLTGVSQGAVTAIVVWHTFGPTIAHDRLVWQIPLIAISGAFFSASITWIIASSEGKSSPMRLILIGVLTGGVLSSITTISLLWAETDPQELIAWLSGSLSATTWNDVKLVSCGLLLMAPFVLLSIPRANLMQLGDDLTAGLGQNVKGGRIMVLLTACGLTAVAICTVGSVGFVGLMVPHMLRWFTGSDQRRLVPAAALVGGLLVVIVDLLARNVKANHLSDLTGLPMGSATLPVGVYLALIGGLFFLFLLRRVRV